MPISIPILKMLKKLRNACAHNNCLIADLQTNTTFIPAELGIFVSNIKAIFQVMILLNLVMILHTKFFQFYNLTKRFYYIILLVD